MADPHTISETILALTANRGADKTICPSDAAKALGAQAGVDWHTLMHPVRRAAVALANEGRVVITRKGKPVDPNDFKGVYRIGLPRDD